MRPEDLPERLKELREESGRTFGDLARELHTGTTTLHHWTSGRREPTLADLDRFVRTLKYRLILDIVPADAVEVPPHLPAAAVQLAEAVQDLPPDWIAAMTRLARHWADHPTPRTILKILLLFAAEAEAEAASARKDAPGVG